MYLFVSIVYILVCAFLIFVVLLQQGRGGGMGSAFGGSSQTVFGGAGAGNILTRITAVCATLFMVLSAVLAYMSSSSDSTLDEVTREIEARQAALRAEEPGAAGEASPEAGETPAATEGVPTEATEDPPVLDTDPQTGQEMELAPSEGSSDPAAASPTAVAPSDDEPTE